MPAPAMTKTARKPSRWATAAAEITPSPCPIHSPVANHEKPAPRATVVIWLAWFCRVLWSM